MNLWLLVDKKTPMAGLNPVQVWVGRTNGTIMAGVYRSADDSSFFEDLNGERIEDAKQWMFRKVDVMGDPGPDGFRKSKASASQPAVDW